MTVADMGALIAAFAAKYGIKAQHWRGSSEDIRNRAMREYAAGRYEADVAETAGPDMEAMVREQLLQKIATPVSKELIPQATLPHGQWIATRLSRVRRRLQHQHHQAGRRAEDLRGPARSANSRASSGSRPRTPTGSCRWSASWARQKGLKLFQDIVAKNGMSVRKGHTLLANLVPTGEVPLALTAYSYRVEQLKKEGAPVEIVYLPPVVALPTGAGIFKRAPHPHAALLFEDFILTDGQKILAAREAVPTNPKAGSAAAGPDLRRPAEIPRRGRRSGRKLFKETFSPSALSQASARAPP